MYRKRATPRFYFLLLLIAVGGFFLVRNFLPAGRQWEAMVTIAQTTYSEMLDIVVVRDEEVVSYDGSATIVYTVPEGASVKAGDVVAEVYASGYAEKIMNQLETVRQNIRVYHQTILNDILDNDLERREANVQAKALELKNVLNSDGAGNFGTIEAQLEQTMEERQEYIRANRRDDPSLNNLYDDEAKHLKSIANWKLDQTASKAGIVSFYMDGYERFLSPANLPSLSVNDALAVLNGQKIELGEVSRFSQDIFRLISPNTWDVLLLGDESIWKPLTGKVYSFQVEGYEDVVYSGEVIKVQKEGKRVMAQLSVRGEMGPVMNLRAGRALVGTDLSGLSVPAQAIATQNGQTGIWINDVPGGTFVPVEVISSDSQYAIIEPTTSGSITIGQRVLIK